MKLRDLLANIDYKCISGDIDTDIADLIYDSRKVTENTAFFCMTGAKTDGHEYAEAAIELGASAIIVEYELPLPKTVTQIQVKSTRAALAEASILYFGNPASRMKMIGITGTKGKTSTSFMIKDIIEKSGHACGIIGTIGAMWKDKKVKTGLTTPESYVIHSLLSDMADDGCEYVVMEVSSQAIMLDRTAGITFDIGIFTNFSPDHIGEGEHSSLDEYRRYKQKLFAQSKVGIFNADDEVCDTFIKYSACDANYTFGCSEDCDLKADGISKWSDGGMLGVTFKVSGLIDGDIVLSIPGVFNAYNAMSGMLACKLLDIDENTIMSVLKDVRVLGRVELVPVSDEFSVIVDYAHNEVSTRSVLTTLREYNPAHLISVYGAGGNRSVLRRYDMGEVTGELCDLCVLTCDNPRDEEISAINEDIKIGLARSNGKYVEIEDRVDAIAYAIEHAVKDDIIILLGKGHEDYMEIKGKKYHYDEREAVREAYAKVCKKRNG